MGLGGCMAFRIVFWDMLMISLMRMCLRLGNWRYENAYPEFFNS